MGFTDASAGGDSFPDTRPSDASVAARPDGGFAAPCDPGSGLLRVERGLCLGFEEASQATAYAIDFAARRVIGSAPLFKTTASGAEWMGSLDPALLSGAPSCEAVSDRIFVIAVGRDAAGNVVATCHEDRSRDTDYIGGVSGVLNTCKGGTSITAAAAAASSQLELFEWDGQSPDIGAGTLLTRSSEPPLTVFRIPADPARACSSSKPPVFFLVAHAEGSSQVLGVYAFAHYN